MSHLPLFFRSWVISIGFYVLLAGPAGAAGPTFTLAQTLSDQAQRTTLAFSGLAMMTGNLEAQSFFPPGKVADYTGFQYLRDNDPDGMGHNTSFLTRVANNVIYTLNDSQFAQLKALATVQIAQINLYGYQRYPLMKAFRRLIDGDLPSGATGLNLNAVKKASRELYLLDGQISFDRAVLYAKIVNSLDATQTAYLTAMKGKGWNSWPDITNDQIKSKMQGLPQGTAVAVMTYASDLFSWYAGSVEADVYFCPERHGTYFGSFYIKDAPAIGHEGYSIDEQLTATAGAALSDSTKGYVTPAQATLMSSLVDKQRDNLYASSTANIVKARTEIATLLRSLLTMTGSTDAIRAQVLALSSLYGDLDGENNYNYANVFAQVYETLTTAQKTKLADLRKSIMSGKYADGTPFDYSVATTFFLYSEAIKDVSLLAPYVANTDYLFFEPNASVIASLPVFSGDYNGDGKADLIWLNSTTGQAYGMLMNGVAISQQGLFYQEPNTAWRIVQNGDFDGNGRDDLLWWNNQTGQVYEMVMNGLNIAGGAVIYQEPNTTWQIVAVGDLNGDGKEDLIWWNSSSGQVYGMLMNGTGIAQGGMLYQEANTAWRILAARDFTGDGKADLLWRNQTTGHVYLMPMNGLIIAGGAMVYQEPDLAWSIVAVGDFNGDGKADLIWRNSQTGQVYGMLMNGSLIVAQGMMYQEPDTAWQIIANGDYTGDGKTDLLWRHATTGQLYEMPMNGLLVTSGAVIYQEANPVWRIVASAEARKGPSTSPNVVGTARNGEVLSGAPLNQSVPLDGEPVNAYSPLAGAPLNPGSLPAP